MDFVMKQALGGEAQAPHPHPQPGSEPRWERALAHQTPLFPTLGTPVLNLSLPNPSPAGATKDMGKMLGGEEEKDPDARRRRRSGRRHCGSRRRSARPSTRAWRRSVRRSGSRSETRSAPPTYLPWSVGAQGYNGSPNPGLELS